MSSGRKCKGRQKIEIKKMTNQSNLQVTFSKRRVGVFKKASELSILCGAEVALMIFSPTDKVFSFGHPNLDDIMNRYISGAPPPYAQSSIQHLMEAQRDAKVCELSADLNGLTNELEAGRKHVEELNKLQKASEAECWWAGPIQEMNNQQKEKLKFALKEMKKSIDKHQSENIRFQTAMNPNPFLELGNSSSNPAMMPRMLQTPLVQNPHLHQNDLDLGLRMMNPYGFHNMGGYGSGGGFY